MIVFHSYVLNSAQQLSIQPCMFLKRQRYDSPTPPRIIGYSWRKTNSLKILIKNDNKVFSFSLRQTLRLDKSLKTKIKTNCWCTYQWETNKTDEAVFDHPSSPTEYSFTNSIFASCFQSPFLINLLNWIVIAAFNQL